MAGQKAKVSPCPIMMDIFVPKGLAAGAAKRGYRINIFTRSKGLAANTAKTECIKIALEI